VEPGELFARELRGAEDRLRAAGLSGRSAFLALTRHLSMRLSLPEHLWPDGPDAPAIARLEQIPLAADLDLFGLAYERFFTDLFKGQKGQYFTPRPLVELMADLAEVGPRDRVLDPTCGSGGFLVAGMDRGADVDGMDVDPDLVTLARLNLALHGGNPKAVQQGDFFRNPPEETWDVILANPPFSMVVDDPDTLAGFELARSRTKVASDALFLEAAWRRLVPNGRLCTVLPYSVLVNPTAEPIREWVEAHFVRRAVVALPEGVFRPFGGTATRACVLLLQRRPARVAEMLVADIDQPGFDPSRKEYRRCEPDQLAALRLSLRGVPFERAIRTDPGGAWAPSDHLRKESVGAGVSRVRFGSLAHMEVNRLDPSAEPGEAFTEVDLSDLDKETGEVSGARVRQGADFARGQSKATFEEGDLLFGKMRPNLNNVAVATRPRPGLPERMVGSGEWVPFRASRDSYFALLALRSIFAREQLTTTGGQTRPRARVEDIPEVKVPDPGAEARERFHFLLRSIHEERMRLRHLLVEVEALYECFGRGSVNEEGLRTALAELEGRREVPGGDIDGEEPEGC
jgi:type I restriction enzyme M protein